RSRGPTPPGRETRWWERSGGMTVNEQTILSVLVESFRLILPEMVLGLTACVLFVGATFRASRHAWGAVALAGLLAAVAVALAADGRYPPSLERAAVFAGPLVSDPLAALVKLLALATGVILLLLSWNEV